MRVGVLALQGGFAAHAKALLALGHQALELRYPEDLAELDGVILPGGESTTQIKLLRFSGLDDALDAFIQAGKPLLTTCAGTILAAADVRDPSQKSFSWIDIAVSRNAWGRQVDSFEAKTDSTGTRAELVDFPLVFIRAPRILETGPAVETMASFKGEPVLVRQDNRYAATFHPELSQDLRVHRQVF